eukprot:119142_1
MSTVFASCSPVQLVLSYIFVFVCATLIIFIVWILIKFCKSSPEIAKSIQRMQYVFMITTILGIAMLGIQKLLQCYMATSLLQYFSLLYLFFFAMQSYLLLFIFYIKLRMVFNGNVLAITPCTNACYMTMFVGMPFSFMMAIIFFFVLPVAFFWFVTLFLFVAVLTMVSLVGLFVHKLIKVNHHCKADEELVSLITRITLLGIISISITIVNALDGIFVVDGVVYEWITRYIALFDLFSNLICIIMGHQMFKKYYFILCSPLDRCCRLCCSVMVRDETMLASVSSDNVPTSQSSISSKTGTTGTTVILH